MTRPASQTPGVYINGQNAFSNTLIPVPTAVPAFIGYTPTALCEGKSYTNIAQKITSFADFQAIYCYPGPQKQYQPQYYLVSQKSQPQKGDYIIIDNTIYSIVPDPSTIYYLYNSVRLFYENGGGDAYIVSVGPYKTPFQNPGIPGEQIINSNIQLSELLNGLAMLAGEQEPTMYICPEATLLTADDNATLMQKMLLQCTQMRTSISIFDLIGGREPDAALYTNDIDTFRNNTGDLGLSYGVAYYPFIITTLMDTTDIDYTNLFGGDVTQLSAILKPAENSNPNVGAILANILDPTSTLTVAQHHDALLNNSKIFGTIIKHILSGVNNLPASGAIAGIITRIDNERGVWQAPANVSITGAVYLPINLSDSQTGNLNIDPVSGKSINTIRFFNDIGILIWGARTLDGNSQDWRYLSVRRTAIFLEQSCKLAIQAFMFEPNDKNTWENVKSVIINFLTSLWKQGALQGAVVSEAFSVECGLGITMTSDDVLNGYMNVVVKASLAHPAEFILLTFQQRMAAAG